MGMAASRFRRIGGNFPNGFTDDQYVVAILLLEKYFFENIDFLVFNKNQAESKCSWENKHRCLDDYILTLYCKVH